MVLHACNRAEDLNTEHTLKTLLFKLPDYLQNKWNKEVRKTSNKKPTYELLMKVILQEHEIKTDDINQWVEELKADKLSPDLGTNSNPPDFDNEFASETDVADSDSIVEDRTDVEIEVKSPLDAATSCLCGSRLEVSCHSCLADCPSYKQAHNVDQRWKLLVGQGACFRCLRFGHKAIDCPEGPCLVEGCSQHHHASLHKIYEYTPNIYPPLHNNHHSPHLLYNVNQMNRNIAPYRSMGNEFRIPCTAPG